MRWLAIVVAGCAVGPDFHHPPAPRVTSYTRAAVRETASAGGVAQVMRSGEPLAAQWWQLFHSRPLDGVVADALANNPSLDAARASLRRSRHALAAGFGVFFPQLDVNAGPSRERFAPSTFGLPTAPSEFNLYTARGTLGYTFDVFGGQRRSIEGLQAQVDAQCYALAAARLMVTGNVVQTVIARAGYAAEITATEQLVASLRDQVGIAKTQAEAGTAPYANVLTAAGQLATTEATLPPLRLRLAQADDLLATLVGRAPAAWQPPAIALAELVLPRELPVSLPSQLVRQRPDVLVAEATLHVASANIGVATAAMLPSFSVTGTAGFQSNTLGNLVSTATWVWNVAGSIAAPIFHGGTLHHQRLAAIEAYKQSLASYEQTVLGALGDVANALSAIALDADALAAQATAVDAWSQAKKLVEANYAAGVTDYVQVLVTEDQYLQAELAYVAAQTQRLQDTVALFVALGGGWWADRPGLCD